MNAKRKYPQSFYNDGLGDFLEWIDDEVLIHGENKSKNKKDNSKTSLKNKKERAKKLYGNNDVSELIETKKTTKIKPMQMPEIKLEVKQDKALENRVRGLVNRLAAQTMPFVVSEFEKLYSTNPRQTVNNALFTLVDSSIIIGSSITKRKHIAEFMLLISYLSSTISQDIGSTLVHQLVVKFEELYKSQDNEDKRLENILICLMNLYSIGLISCHVIFEITKRICSTFNLRSIELLLTILRSVGFQLRKESPLSMKQLIIVTQEQCSQLKQEVKAGSRLEFMMEALGAIKNNNASKLSNYGCDIDKDTIESVLKLLIKRAKMAQCLSDATYEDILYSPNWYLLDNRLDEQQEPDCGQQKLKSNQQAADKKSNKTDDKICKALGLNKPTEKTIFKALVRAADHIEATNIIIGFGLNYCSDAIIVILQVAIHEKKFNPFHFRLLNSLCKFNRKYKMAAKFSIQDKIRALSSMTGARVEIFKRLCLDLIKADAVPITILKAVEWANISGSTKEFLTYILEAVSELPEEENRKIMMKVDKKSSFAGAMRTFIRCFLKGCKLFQ